MVSRRAEHCLHAFLEWKECGHPDSVNWRPRAQASGNYRKQRGLVPRREMARLWRWEAREPLPLLADHRRAEAFDDGPCWFRWGRFSGVLARWAATRVYPCNCGGYHEHLPSAAK